MKRACRRVFLHSEFACTKYTWQESSEIARREARWWAVIAAADASVDASWPWQSGAAGTAWQAGFSSIARRTRRAGEAAACAWASLRARWAF